MNLYECIVHFKDGSSFKAVLSDYHIENMKEVAMVEKVTKGEKK